MSYLDAVKTGREKVPRRTLIYGAHGVGKTTWAAGWPNPVLIPTEDGYHHIDVPHGPLIKTVAGLQQAIKDVTESDFDTVILDSIDWAEKLIVEELDASNFDQSWGKGAVEIGHRFDTVILDSIDWAEKLIVEELDASNFDQSWGKGAVEIGHRISKLLLLLNGCRDAGKHVVLVGHQHIAKIVRTDGKEYGSHTVNLTKHAARVVCEWADEVLFAETDIIVKTSESKFGGIAVDKGTRSLHTSSSPLFDAKNRIVGLPERFELSEVSSYLEFV